MATADVTEGQSRGQFHAPSVSTRRLGSAVYEACVVLTGRADGEAIPSPVISYVAAQQGIAEADKGAMEVGNVKIPTWYTGSRCVAIDVKYVSLIIKRKK